MVETFLRELQEYTNKNFSSAKTEYKIVRSIRLEFRMAFSQDTIVDIFYNALTGRKDFTIIYQNVRIFGFDNLHGWHFHPYQESEKHIPCQEPTLEEIFEKIKGIFELLIPHA